MEMIPDFFHRAFTKEIRVLHLTLPLFLQLLLEYMVWRVEEEDKLKEI